MHEHAPLPDAVRATIANWVSDFLERPSATGPAGRVGPDAPAILAAFLEAACPGGAQPADIESGEVAHALFDHVARLDLPQPVLQAVPPLLSAFLADLQEVGRLAGGRALAAQVRAATPAYNERAAGRVRQEQRVAAKIGRNDPCPCGSGRKYKRCCLGALDG